VLALVSCTACSAPDPDDPETRSREEQANVDLVLRTMEEGIIGGDPTVLAQLVREDYEQHSLTIADGRAGLLSYAQQLRASGQARIEIHRILADGDLVALHSSYGVDDPDTSGDERRVAFDVLRVEAGQLA